MEDPINDAIQNGTLGDDECIKQLFTRRLNLANQTVLSPDLRDRGLGIIDTAIDAEVPKALSVGEPVVRVLQRVFTEIGRLYQEDAQRLAPQAAKEDSATANATEVQAKKQSPNHDEDSREEDVDMTDYDTGDDTNEGLSEDESDYGQAHKSKGKRRPGRPRTVYRYNERVKAALAARQRRKFLTHSSPRGSAAKDPRRRLYGSFADSLQTGKAASGSSGPEGGIEESHTTKSKQDDRQTFTFDAKANEEANKPSLIVTLKASAASVQEDGPTPQRRPARRKSTRKTKARETVDSGSQGRAARRDDETTGKTGEEESDTERQDANSPGDRKPPTRTRRPRGAPNPVATPSAPRTRLRTKSQPYSYQEIPQLPPLRRRRRNAISSKQSPLLALDSQAAVLAATSSPSNSSIHSHPAISSSPSPPPPPQSPNHASSPVLLLPPPPPPSTPSQTAHTFPPFPPLSPRALPHFHRGTIIALENILTDHEAEPDTRLLDIIQELDDTRPIVTNWEHVTVMRGGSWVYEALRALVEEMDEDEDEHGDGDEDGNDENESADVEMCVTYLQAWITEEMKGRGSIE